MNGSIKNRATAIRQYLHIRDDLSADAATIYKYSVTAAQWEAVRLLIDRGKGTPADDTRFADLSRVLQMLSNELGQWGPAVDHAHPHQPGETYPHYIPGLTDLYGFLPGDPSRLIDETWQEAAKGW